MPLLGLWKSSPDTISQMSLEQIVKISGDGVLRDNSETSREFREYISQISREQIESYVSYCLSNSFTPSGYVLQDLVNELGRRLEYTVENGIYTGTRKAIGFDGIWKSPDGNSIVVEVKTTDTYRINLDVLVNYRARLFKNGLIGENSSLLIVVGRQDTGDIEAQIRGSRHAWDIRIISAESLLKIVALKEDSGNEDALKKIRSLLVPFEYTRLDNIIDIMFTAATDASTNDDLPQDGAAQENISVSGNRTYKQSRTDSDVIKRIRQDIVDSYGRAMSTSFIARSRASFWTHDKKIRVVCTISKRYIKKSYYWYAFHKKWLDFLNDGEVGIYMIGFVDQNKYVSIPVDFMAGCVERLHKSNVHGDLYWHIVVDESYSGFSLQLPGSSSLDLSSFTHAY